MGPLTFAAQGSDVQCLALQLQAHEAVLWPAAGRVPVARRQLEGVGESVLQLGHLVHPVEPVGALLGLRCSSRALLGGSSSSSSDLGRSSSGSGNGQVRSGLLGRWCRQALLPL